MTCKSIEIAEKDKDVIQCFETNESCARTTSALRISVGRIFVTGTRTKQVFVGIKDLKFQTLP